VNKSRNRAVFGVLFLILFFFVILILFANFTMKAFQADNSRSLRGKKDIIGVIEVEGPIMESKKIIELLHVAEREDNIKAIIVRIDSPGGAVGPTQEIYHEMRRIDDAYNRSLQETNDEEKSNEDKGKNKDEKHSYTKGKPVYASFGSIAASGGYYLGAAARKIYANPGTLTGSIGVIMQFMDLSGLYEFAKVNPNTIKAGRYKDLGQPNRGLTKEEEGLMGDLLATVHKQFVDDILLLRKDKIKGDIWDHAQGQIFSGQEAFEVGLVDSLGSLWSAGREIHQELGLQSEFDLHFIEEKKRMNLWDILEGIEQVASKLNFQAVTDGMPRIMFMR